MSEEERKQTVRPQPMKADIPDLDQVPADISPENLAFLKGLIDSFNVSTARLREAYAVLQENVKSLNMQLEVTNRELSESLEEQERLSNYLTNILESLSSGVLVIDKTGTVTLFNRGAEEMTGVAVSDALGRHYSDVMGGDTDDELTPLWTLTSGQGHAQIEKVVISRSGRRLPVGCSISPLTTSSGEMIGAVEIFMDLTRIKALEDELAHEEKLAALGRMAATMAHKIRNPLGGIAGFAGLLGRELKDSENGLRLVGKISEGVDKLERIVTSLLSYTAQTNLSPGMVDLAEFVDDVVRSGGWSAGGIAVECPDGPVFAEVDTASLKVAVLNIVQNAVEATADSGEVIILIAPDDTKFSPGHQLASMVLDTIRGAPEARQSLMSRTLIVVSDTGTGMNEEARGQLFVPFYTTKENGIGLGLAHARKNIEEHRGEIVIESEEGVGTAVGIALPGRSAL